MWYVTRFWDDRPQLRYLLYIRRHDWLALICDIICDRIWYMIWYVICLTVLTWKAWAPLPPAYPPAWLAGCAQPQRRGWPPRPWRPTEPASASRESETSGHHDIILKSSWHHLEIILTSSWYHLRVENQRHWDVVIVIMIKIIMIVIMTGGT